MFKTWLLGFSLLATATAGSARAAILDVTFSGTVASAQGTGYSIGNPITGEFVYDTGSSSFDYFRIGTFTASGSLTPSVNFSLGNLGALYTLGVSAVQNGGTVNQSFTLDLESLNNAFTDATPVALLTDGTALTTNLDTSAADSPFNSVFTFTNANSDGTGITSVSADLSSVSTQVPEPASLALLATGTLAAFGLRSRRG